MATTNNDRRDRTKCFALDIIRMFTSPPKTDEARVIGRQVLRSGTSAGANYREAYRSRSRMEFAAKAGDCLKELEETAYWLELLAEGGIVEEKRLAALRKECDELTAIFATIVKNARSRYFSSSCFSLLLLTLLVVPTTDFIILIFY